MLPLLCAGMLTRCAAPAMLQVSGAGKVTFPDGTSGRPRQEGRPRRWSRCRRLVCFVPGPRLTPFPAASFCARAPTGTFQDRKLVTGGKQASAVKQAQDAAAEARNQANAADALKG